MRTQDSKILLAPMYSFLPRAWVRLNYDSHPCWLIGDKLHEGVSDLNAGYIPGKIQGAGLSTDIACHGSGNDDSATSLLDIDLTCLQEV